MQYFDLSHIECGFTLGDKTTVTSWEVPDGKTVIGNGAFSGFTGLRSITIPDSVKEIGDNAFLNCRNLRSVTLPAGLRRIWNEAFRGRLGEIGRAHV